MKKHHSALSTLPSRYVEVHQSQMHYIESGSGFPILFLHGIPASGSVWRHIIPYLSTLGRCIAPDLIGYGLSDKPDIQYTLDDHCHYINGFIRALNLTHLVIVMHGFGSLPGLHYALANEKNCRGLIFYEAFIRPMTGDDVSLPYQEQTMRLQKKILHVNSVQSGQQLIDEAVSQAMLASPAKELLDLYHQPFSSVNAIKPFNQYLNEASSGKGNNGINEKLQSMSSMLTLSTIPKLLLYSVPGFITTMNTIIWAKSNLKNLEIIDTGEEFHYGMETSPELIGEAMSVWLQGIEQSRSERAS